MNHSSPLTLQDASHRDSAWERAANYKKEERPIRPVRKIVAKGAVDVVFFRSPSAHLVVAGENQEVIIKGSADVTLYDPQQTILDLGVQGSGGITAFGRVDLPDGEVAGSGDVDASELVATSAKLSVAGSGDIYAYVSNSVKARVAGAGDIVIRGNPPIRDHSVAGSGDIKFKKM